MKNENKHTNQAIVKSLSKFALSKVLEKEKVQSNGSPNWDSKINSKKYGDMYE